MVLGVVAPSISNFNIMMAPNKVQLHATFSEAHVHLTHTHVLFIMCFGHQHDVVAKLCFFVDCMVKEEVML